LLRPFPQETKPVLIQTYRKGKVVEAFRAFKKAYVETVDLLLDHLKSHEADERTR